MSETNSGTRGITSGDNPFDQPAINSEQEQKLHSLRGVLQEQIASVTTPEFAKEAFGEESPFAAALKEIDIQQGVTPGQFGEILRDVAAHEPIIQDHDVWDRELNDVIAVEEYHPTINQYGLQILDGTGPNGAYYLWIRRNRGNMQNKIIVFPDPDNILAHPVEIVELGKPDGQVYYRSEHLFDRLFDSVYARDAVREERQARKTHGPVGDRLKGLGVIPSDTLPYSYSQHRALVEHSKLIIGFSNLYDAQKDQVEENDEWLGERTSRLFDEMTNYIGDDNERIFELQRGENITPFSSEFWDNIREVANRLPRLRNGDFDPEDRIYTNDPEIISNEALIQIKTFLHYFQDNRRYDPDHFSDVADDSYYKDHVGSRNNKQNVERGLGIQLMRLVPDDYPSRKSAERALKRIMRLPLDWTDYQEHRFN